MVAGAKKLELVFMRFMSQFGCHLPNRLRNTWAVFQFYVACHHFLWPFGTNFLIKLWLCASRNADTGRVFSNYSKQWTLSKIYGWMYLTPSLSPNLLKSMQMVAQLFSFTFRPSIVETGQQWSLLPWKVVLLPTCNGFGLRIPHCLWFFFGGAFAKQVDSVIKKKSHTNLAGWHGNSKAKIMI